MNERIPSDPWRKRVGESASLATREELPPDEAGGCSLVLAVESGAQPAEFVLKPGMTLTIGRRSSMQTGSDQDLPTVEQDNAGNLVVRGNPHVSGRHARLEVREDGEVRVTDLGSLNGTFIGSLDRQTPPQEAVPLPVNERLILCRRAQLTFVLREET